MKIKEYKDRGLGLCVIFELPFMDIETRRPKEWAFTEHNLRIRIANIKAGKNGYNTDTALEEEALAVLVATNNQQGK